MQDVQGVRRKSVTGEQYVKPTNLEAWNEIGRRILENMKAEINRQSSCEHIYGFVDGDPFDTDRELIYQPMDEDCFDLRFTYCPKCGKRLI